MNLYLNTNIDNHNETSFLTRLADTCLLPSRYLCNAASIEILNGEVIQEEPLFPEKNYLYTAAAIIALVPGIIFGTFTRLLAVLLGDNAMSRTIADQFYKRSIQLPQVPAGTTLAQYSQATTDQTTQILNRIQEDRAIWQDPQFIQDFTTVMENAYRYTEIYFRQLAAECNNDPAAMKDRMILQPQNRRSGDTSQDYSHTFFHITKLYHLARGCNSRITREMAERWGYLPHEEAPMRPEQPLPLVKQEPYFNPTKPQYQWRQLYNTFCDKVDQAGLRSLLEANGGDGRFSKWSKHDTHKVSHYVFPDTLPT